MSRYTHIIQVLKERRIQCILLSTPYLLIMLALYAYIYNGHPSALYRLFTPGYTIPFTILTVLISGMVGVTATLMIAKVKEVRLKSAGLGVAGVITGSLAAGCPGCVFGLFPLVLSAFGITGTLALLPWNGIEFQVLTVALLSISIWLLGEETELSCTVPRRKKK